MATDGEAGNHSGAGAAFGDVLFGVAHAAAFVGAQRRDGFSGKIVMLQEGEDAHGCRAAPAGVAHVNRVIAGNVRDVGLDLRTGTGPGFVGGFHAAGPVVGGVSLHRVDLKQIGPQILCQIFRGILRVAFFQHLDAAGHVIFSCAGVVDNQRSCHNDTS